MDKKEWACAQIQEKFNELGRLPTKGDFDEKTRVRIKAALGPWPRALETAGVKPVSQNRLKKLQKVCRDFDKEKTRAE